MKTLFTLLAFVAGIAVNAQNTQDDLDRKHVNLNKIDNLSGLGANDKAASIYAALSAMYPNDSLIMFHAAKRYCMNGSVKSDTLMLKTALVYLDSMIALYPTNKFYGLYSSFATIRLTDVTNQYKSNSEKKPSIPVYEKCIKYIDDNASAFLKNPTLNSTVRYFMEQANSAKSTVKMIKFEIE